MIAKHVGCKPGTFGASDRAQPAYDSMKRRQMRAKTVKPFKIDAAFQDGVW